MNSQIKDGRGKLIMEEKKISMRSAFILTAIGVIIFLIFEAYLFCPDYCLLFALMSFMPFIFLAFPLERKYPFAIYENGFEAPLEFYKVLKGEERFVYFREITKIYPIYNTSTSIQNIIGYLVKTSDGKEIQVIPPALGSIEIYEKALRKALGPKWERLYDPKPYDLLDDFNPEKMKRCLSKRGRRILYVGYMFLFSIVPVLILLPFLLERHFLILWYLTMASFVLGYVGAIIVGLSYRCKRKYEVISRFYPEVLKGMDVETYGVDPIKKASGYTEDDWKRLEKGLKVSPIYIMLIGFVVMISFMGIMDIPGIQLYGYAGFVVGFTLLIIAIIHVLIMQNRIDLLKAVIEEEHKTGKRIMPDDFEIPEWMFGWIPFRDPPDFSEKEWKMISENAEMTEKKVFVLFLLLGLSFLFSIIFLFLLSSRIGLPSSISTIVFFAIFFMPFIWILIKMRYYNFARRLVEYEETTGKRIIPETHRRKIESGIKSSYTWKKR